MCQDTSHSASAADFTAKNAGVVFLVVLIALPVINSMVVSVFRFMQGKEWLSLHVMPAYEFAAVTREIRGIIQPWLMLGITFLLLRFRYKGQRNAEISARFGLVWRPPTRTAVTSFMLGIFIAGVSGLLMRIFPPEFEPVPHPLNALAQTSFWLQLVYALTLVTVVPIAEELIFRGVLFTGLSNSWGRLLAGLAVVTSFVCVHPEILGSGYWLTHVSLVAISAILTLVRAFTGVLTASIFLHSGLNFAELFVF